MPTVDERLASIESKIDKLLATRAAAPASSGGGDVAADHELDGKEFPIRKNPSAKYWTGDSYEGRLMSECPPDYLDALAKYKDACAFMNEKSGDASKAKYIEYDRRDAKLARGFATRIRAGWKPNATPARAAAPEPDYGGNASSDTDEIPF